MYQLRIKYQNGQDVDDYATTKREVVQIIANETGLSQREVRNWVAAKDESEMYYDSRGFRVQVWYQ